ncbi:tetraspanin-16 isoform X1 [Pipistrellus kuhlii]|uniref:Tetraspanin n=1 Tax=Pipistrellus kuhlii TaxID=59472 RepID=A0A7J7TAR0_PIPKU|nr:tetraspanin-16 isoform X1 [Pipistrellus kuhlii]KAF6297801.1 tetraspanin 16 [Pipistrellus kuhlii]
MAEMHTPYSSLKKLLCLLHGFLAMSGVILIGLGIYVSFRGAVLTTVLGVFSTHLFHVGYLCLVMGCLTVLLGFAGWYATSKESRGILLFCLVWMVVVLIVEITVATLVLAFLPIVQDAALEHNFVALKRNYRGYNEPDDFSVEWNLVMETLKCCGVKNYTDFSGSSFERTTGYTYPRSCCKDMGTAACTGRNASSGAIHQEGCFPKLLKIAKTQSINLSAGSLGAAVIQLPGILATLLLFAKLG